MPNTQRYLVVAPQGLGDALEATPFVAALKQARPDAAIDVLVTRAQPKALFEGLTELAGEVIFLPFWESGAARFIKTLLVKRWRSPYDASFLMYPAARKEYQILLRAFPARRRFSHRYFENTLRSLLFLSSDLVPIVRRHNVQRNLDLLAAADIAHEMPDRYFVPASWIDPAPRTERRVVLHVGTIAHDGLESRRWPLERFTAVARELVAEGYPVAALMGPAEKNETLALRKSVPEVEIFEGSLDQAARFLSHASAVLTNDSGIGHLAAAVGSPTVALFGPTPLEHAPFGPTATALRPSACPPCFDPRFLNTGCALNIGYRCLKEDLPVSLVLQTLRKCLSAGAI